MIPTQHRTETIQAKAARVLFTLDCLVAGVAAGRKLARQRKLDEQHAANIAARWQG